MGADMLLYAIPACEINEKRRQELLDLIPQVNECPDYCELDEFHNRLYEAVEELGDDIGTRRDVTSFFDGRKWWLMTGGLSHGDHPTDAAEIFENITCSPLWTKLQQWHDEDHQSTFVRVVMNAGYVVPRDNQDMLEDAKQSLFEDVENAVKHDELWNWIGVVDAPEATDADVADFLKEADAYIKSDGEIDRKGE